MDVASEWVRPATAKDRPAVLSLLLAEKLDPEFQALEFAVCEAKGRVIGCVRAKRLPEGGTELASLVVAKPHRGRGLARSLVTLALLGARHPVYALTLVPDFASRAGFEPVRVEDLPQSLQAKAAACTAGGAPWLAMRLRRASVTPIQESDPGPAPDFLDA